MVGVRVCWVVGEGEGGAGKCSVPVEDDSRTDTQIL